MRKHPGAAQSAAAAVRRGAPVVRKLCRRGRFVPQQWRMDMAGARKIAVVVGSLRKESFNRMAARALAGLAPEGIKLEIVEIRDLPLY
ncbi:MAG: NADPH-dependent FMN reductase, partial [Burkholderiales bacterium]